MVYSLGASTSLRNWCTIPVVLLIGLYLLKLAVVNHVLLRHLYVGSTFSGFLVCLDTPIEFLGTIATFWWTCIPTVQLCRLLEFVCADLWKIIHFRPIYIDAQITQTMLLRSGPMNAISKAASHTLRLDWALLIICLCLRVVISYADKLLKRSIICCVHFGFSLRKSYRGPLGFDFHWKWLLKTIFDCRARRSLEKFSCSLLWLVIWPAYCGSFICQFTITARFDLLIVASRELLRTGRIFLAELRLNHFVSFSQWKILLPFHLKFLRYDIS